MSYRYVLCLALTVACCIVCTSCANAPPATPQVIAQAATELATQPPLPITESVPPTTERDEAMTSLPPTETPEAAATVAPTDSPVPSTGTGLPPTDTAIPPTQAPLQPTDTPLPSATPLPTEPPTDTPVPTSALPLTPDPATGAQIWAEAPCMACHGAGAQGQIGPKLAGTGLSFDQVLATVRLGKGQMPAFDENTISDLALRHIWTWLRSLTRPTPTPIAPPSFPTQALSEMWYFVNEMRIRADFAKDLPVRQAQDDAGRLEVVKAYSRDGLAQTAQVIARANEALNQVPGEAVREIIRQVIDDTNQVTDLFNQALAQNSYGQAWPFVAEAARICRIDALPWAAQAVRDAGLVGNVRIRVVDQAGNPISGAFVTALTAHTPVGVRADAAGRVTLANMAAVPALPVKAYAEGRVYHEINANLSPGATTDGTIALPPLPGQGLAPAVANPAIQPSSGPGNAVVTFAVTATDPQGRLDLAEDQIFALSPDLGLAYVLLYAGGDRYQSAQRLPDLATGVYTWYFFAVDHECHTSQIVPLRYQVQ